MSAAGDVPAVARRARARRDRSRGVQHRASRRQRHDAEGRSHACRWKGCGRARGRRCERRWRGCGRRRFRGGRRHVFRRCDIRDKGGSRELGGVSLAGIGACHRAVVFTGRRVGVAFIALRDPCADREPAIAEESDGARRHVPVAPSDLRFPVACLVALQSGHFDDLTFEFLTFGGRDRHLGFVRGRRERQQHEREHADEPPRGGSWSELQAHAWKRAFRT